MLSECLRKFHQIPRRALWWAAAGLALLCQLVAVALVADEQVAKARIRDYQRSIEMQAIAQCIETRAGTARHRCIQQARVVASHSFPPDGSPPGEAGPVMANNGTGAAASAMPMQPAQGYMAGPFAIR
jgi:hypothetical protein